jgi:hypothetical protein
MAKLGVSKFIQISGLLLLLVVLPLVSWYYLNRGYDYQLQARSELKDLGAWSVDSSGIDTVGYTGIFTIVNQDSFRDSLLRQTLNKLIEQFGERPDFLVGLIKSDINVSTLDLSDTSRVIYLDKVNLHSELSFLDGMLYLSDRKGTVRNSYNYRSMAEIRRMVEHIALILPQQPSSDIIFVPESEK